MSICDLNYLEVIAEDSSIIGGARLVDADVKVKVTGGKPKLNLSINPLTGENTVGFTNQLKVGTAAAVSVGGKAVASVNL